MKMSSIVRAVKKLKILALEGGGLQGYRLRGLIKSGHLRGL